MKVCAPPDTVSNLRRHLLSPGFVATDPLSSRNTTSSNSTYTELPSLTGSRKSSKESVMQHEPLSPMLAQVKHNPNADDPLRTTGHITDRALDRIKKVKADRLARRHDGLTKGRYHVPNPALEVLETINDWVRVKHSKTGETWYYNKQSEFVSFERPYHLCSAQEFADRERSILILKEVPPELRTRDQLASLSRLLKECNLLQQFGSETLQQACRMMRHKTVNSKEAIIWEGDDSDCFYYLIRGNVGVWTHAGSKEISGKTGGRVQKEISEKTGGPVGSRKVVVLGEGAGFGEQGLIYDEKRNASVVTEVGVCDFAVIDKKCFCEILKDHFVKAAAARCSFLQKNLPVLLGPDRNAYGSYEQLAGFFKEAPALKGQLLCETGKIKDTLDIIYEGSCKIVWHAKVPGEGNLDKRQKFELVDLRKGQYVGLSSILTGKPEPYDVICTSPVKVLRIQKTDVSTRLPMLMQEIILEEELIRITRYAELAKRQATMLLVDDLSKDLLHEAGIRRNSLSGGDLAGDAARAAAAYSQPPTSDSLPQEFEAEETDSEFGSDDESKGGSDGGKPHRPTFGKSDKPWDGGKEVFEGLHNSLSRLRRNSCHGLRQETRKGSKPPDAGVRDMLWGTKPVSPKQPLAPLSLSPAPSVPPPAAPYGGQPRRRSI
jgi:CRP-like cAMP-binding protein